MPDPKAANRMARKRQRDREAGFTGILVKVPANPEAIQQVRELAARLCAEFSADFQPPG